MSEPFLAAATLGDRIRKARQGLDWSQERLAEESGLHWTYVSSIERGERNVSLRNILKVAQALGVDPADLMKGLSP